MSIYCWKDDIRDDGDGGKCQECHIKYVMAFMYVHCKCMYLATISSWNFRHPFDSFLLSNALFLSPSWSLFILLLQSKLNWWDGVIVIATKIAAMMLAVPTRQKKNNWPYQINLLWQLRAHTCTHTHRKCHCFKRFHLNHKILEHNRLSFTHSFQNCHTLILFFNLNTKSNKYSKWMVGAMSTVF